MEYIAAAAASCRMLARLCMSEPLWKHLVSQLWPQLPRRLQPCLEGEAAPTSWREVARARARQPCWRRVCVRTDELERLVSSPNPDGDRFASLVVGVFSIQANPLAQPEGRAWARLMRKALVSPTALGALQRWAATRAASLDEFYESCDASAAAGLARREVLLRALRAASALRFVQDELLESADDESEGAGEGGQTVALEGASALWSVAGLPSAVEEITSALASLELEGFNVAVPLYLRPGSMPPSHRWWHARPPLHALGRLHYC